MLPETKVAILSELHAWEDIIHSEEWVVFRKLLKEHADFLQEEANGHLRKHEDRKAGEALRAKDDCQKILNLVTKRISELRKQEESNAG